MTKTLIRIGTSWFRSREAAAAYYAPYIAHPPSSATRAQALDYVDEAIRFGRIHIGTPTPDKCKGMRPGDVLDLGQDGRWCLLSAEHGDYRRHAIEE